MSRSTISTFKLFEIFPDEEAARLYLEARLWPAGVKCPSCGSGERITVRKGGYYRCTQCKPHLTFTVRTGTVLERSHVPLRTWVHAMLIIADEPEMPSASLASALGVTIKTAWKLAANLRLAMAELLWERLKFDESDYQLVPGFSAYRIGRDGSVWTRHRKGGPGRLGFSWRPMAASCNEDGYRVVILCDARRQKQTRVCRLVCEAFHGACPPGQECRHLDGSRVNDAAENLAWGTSTENKADQDRHGTRPRGEKHGRAKLTDAQVGEIRTMRGSALQREVAAKFGVDQTTIGRIWAGKRISYKELIA